MDLITLKLSQKYTDKKIIQMAQGGFVPAIVNSLPTTDISHSTLYLVLKPGNPEGNIYEEYLYVNEKWEMIGTTGVDLSNYYNKSEIDAKIDTIELTPGPQGEKGEKGDTGAQGPQGEQGIQGEPGKDGKDGAQGIQGEQGVPGQDGKDGVDGKDGAQGEPGKDGEDGYTPIKGTDYWTEEDKNEIQGYVETSVNNSVMSLETLLQDMLTAIRNGGTSADTIDTLEQLLVSYLENTTVKEIEG